MRLGLRFFIGVKMIIMRNMLLFGLFSLGLLHVGNVFASNSTHGVGGVSVNVYIENSGSMDGYVASPDVTNGVFLNTLGMLISDLERKYAGNVNVYLLSDPKKQLTDQDKTEIDVSNSFMRTFQSQYSSRRPYRTSDSKLDLLLGYVAKHTQGDTISVFFSDLIFSDPKASPQDALYGIFVKYDIPLLLYRLESLYSGYYYSESNRGIGEKIKAERPFFIAILGQEESLAEISRFTSLRHTGMENYICFSKKENTKIDCKVESGNALLIEKRTKTGTHNRSLTDLKGYDKRLYVKKLKKGEKGIQLTLKLNLSVLPLDNDYITKIANYECPGYEILEIKLIKDKAGYTHSFKLKAKNGYPNIELCLKKKMPDWMSGYSTDCDYPISQYLDKTHHLDLLLSGISKAYGFESADDGCYFKCKVTMLTMSTSSTGKIVLLAVLVLIGGFIIIRVIRNKQYK